jgi:hypothetical protein
MSLWSWAKGYPCSDLTSFPFVHIAILPSPSAQIQALYHTEDILFDRQKITALKLKIALHFNIVIISHSILIRPSFFSNRIAGVRMAYLIPVSPLNLPSSMLPPWLFSIHKIRSRGDCDDGPGISSLPELIPMLCLDLFFAGLQG